MSLGGGPGGGGMDDCLDESALDCREEGGGGGGAAVDLEVLDRLEATEAVRASSMKSKSLSFLFFEDAPPD